MLNSVPYIDINTRTSSLNTHTHTKTHTHTHIHTHTRAHKHMKIASIYLFKKKKKKPLRRLSNPVDGPLLKQNGISQTRSSYFVKGAKDVSKMKSNVIREGKNKKEKKGIGGAQSCRKKVIIYYSFCLVSCCKTCKSGEIPYLSCHWL